MPDSYDPEIGYDPQQAVELPPKRKRKKRVSAITGKETGLQPETELQILMVTHYRQRCLVDPTLRHFTKLYAVNVASGNIAPYLRDLQKRAGKLRGVFDLHFMDRRQKFQYTWIEVKVGKEDYTPEQSDFEEWLSNTPIRCLQARTLNEFMAIIKG